MSRNVRSDTGTWSIYLIQCIASGHVYVGRTMREPQVRWRGHIRDAKRGRGPLYEALRFYGPENFTFTVLCNWECTQVEAGRRERAYIALFRSTDREFGYNVSTGGAGCAGYVPTPEVRAAWSAAQVGHLVTEETKRKLSAAHRGLKKHSAEFKERQRIWASTVARNDVWRKRISQALRHRGSGVYYNRDLRKWHARIKTDSGRLHLGFFDTEEEALSVVTRTRADDARPPPIDDS